LTSIICELCTRTCPENIVCEECVYNSVCEHGEHFSLVCTMDSCSRYGNAYPWKSVWHVKHPLTQRSW